MNNLKLKPLVWALALLCPLAAANDAQSTTQKKEPWQLAEETEVWHPVPAVVTADEGAAPSDAQVLFDGSSLDQWQSVDGGEAKWDITNGVLVVKPQTGDIRTKESYCDAQIHLEWMAPTKVNGADGKELVSQARNNSGIFLQERYEIQILDSYENKTYPNGQAGSVYKQTIPLVNSSRKPGVWQTYDIIFTAPRFDAEKNLESPGNVTVLHNGVVVQNHTEILGKTEWIGKPAYEAHGCAPIRLQDHGNPVSFRNIWIRKL
jgi:hypothetical protein